LFCVLWLYARFLLESALSDVDSSVLRFASWVPASTAPPLTALQQSMVEGNARATRYLRARRNGVYFRAVERDHFKRQHNGIKVVHPVSGTVLFGQIQAFWLHHLCRHPDTPIQVFVEEVWATPLPPDDITGILRCTTRALSTEDANLLAPPFHQTVCLIPGSAFLATSSYFLKTSMTRCF